MNGSDSLIFIVEDEEKMRDILKINLSERYKIKYFSDAEGALQDFDQKRPELIVTDVHLPGMDGIEFMERIKKIHPALPFIVLTGYGNRAFSAGADIGRFLETLGNREAAAQSARDGAVLVEYIMFSF